MMKKNNIATIVKTLSLIAITVAPAANATFYGGGGGNRWGGHNSGGGSYGTVFS